MLREFLNDLLNKEERRLWDEWGVSGHGDMPDIMQVFSEKLYRISQLDDLPYEIGKDLENRSIKINHILEENDREHDELRLWLKVRG